MTSNLVFIDRIEEIKLFDYVCAQAKNKDVPLPILTFLAPEGGGKSTFLNFISTKRLYNRDNPGLRPFAYLDFALVETPKEFLAVFTNIAKQLQKNSSKLKISFPRYDFGLSIITARAENRSWQSISAPKKNSLVWQFYIDQCQNLTDVQQLYLQNSPGLPNKSHFERAILPLAFMTDLYESLQTSLTDCIPAIIVFDNFEQTLAINASSTIGNFASLGELLLQVFANLLPRKNHLFAPILVMLASAERILLESNQDVVFTQGNNFVSVEHVYNQWQQVIPLQSPEYIKLRDLYLPVFFNSFSENDIQNYMSQTLKHSLIKAKLTEPQLRFVKSVTFGHPKAVVEVAKALNVAYSSQNRIDFEVTVQKAIFFSDDLCRNLIASFTDQEQTNLVLCSIPRYLDYKTLRNVLQLSTDIEARECFQHYKKNTWFRLESNSQLEMHPLLRTILQEQISFDYGQVHDNLRRYFLNRVQYGEENAIINMAYHSLALGDSKTVLNLAHQYYDNKDAQLFSLLSVISQAPIRRRGESVELHAFHNFQKALMGDQLAGVDSLVFSTWLLADSGKNDNRDKRVRNWLSTLNNLLKLS